MQRFKSIKKNYLITILVIATLLVARSFLLRKPNNELTYTVSQSTLVDTIQVSGAYITAAQTPVISPSKGIIAKLYVENNDEVKKGDPLFHIDSTASKEEISIAYANYQSAISSSTTTKQAKEGFDATMWAKQKALLDAQNNLNLMNANVSESVDNPATGDEYSELEIGSIKAAYTKAQKEFAVAEKQYREADVAINSSYATIASTKLAYDATQSITVYAPTNGRVVNLLAQVGDGVVTSTLTSPASPVLIIADFSNPSITAQISEAYIPRLQEGQTAVIVFDSARDQSFSGSVSVIDAIGTDTAGIVTYNARIMIDDIAPNIRPGMTGIVTIEILRKPNIVSVPNSAIYWLDNQAHLKLADKNQENLISVELGVRGLAKTEIVSELPAGLVIIANSSSQ